MQTVFSEALLARFREKNNQDGAHYEEPEADRASAGDDPGDRVDPDDSDPMLSVTCKESSVDEIYALPGAQRGQRNGRWPNTLEQSKAPSAAGTPAPPNLLDPAVLRTMPARSPPL
jgi:hypothetical protein